MEAFILMPYAPRAARITDVVEQCDALAALLGKRFTLPQSPHDMAVRGESCYAR
jgi:hypothetical protein